MSKKLFTIVAIFVAVLILPMMSFAEVTTTVTPLPGATAEQIATLNRLYTQIVALQEQLKQLQAQVSGLQSELKLTKRLYMGSKDDEVKTLQQLLSTDTEIYPEGLITGYYGPLTVKAVMKMQMKAGLPVTGQLDDHTIARINEILRDGAGRSGKIPPGLLRAPGILKKLGLTPTTTCSHYDDDGECEDGDDDDSDDDDDDNDDDEDDDDSDDDDDDNNSGRDRTAPVITSQSVSGTTASSTVISWVTNEKTTGKVHFALTSPVAGQGGGLVEFDNTRGTNNSVILDGLTASTTYYYYIKAVDSSNNSTTSADYSFTTTN